MVQENSLKKVIVIVGPTAVGKTNLSVLLAKKYGGEIVNADQSQMHKLLNIGTAKINELEMGGVKHHFIDTLDPTEQYSIKDFQDQARNIIDNMNCLPFIVGGSGLYVDSLITNYDLSVKKRNNYDTSYDNLSNEQLYDRLYSLNQDAALKTHPNNRKRVLRYLEIINEKGNLISNTNSPYYNSLIIFLNNNRDVLYDRINRRCDLMIENGWIDEVKFLIQNNIEVSLIKEIGYNDIYRYLNGELEIDEVVNKIKQDTRHYAKRQITWFKNKMNCIEIINDNNAFNKICTLIDEFIK